MRSISLFGLTVHDLTRAEWRGIVDAWFQEPRLHLIVTPNPEMILHARTHSSCAARINRADLSLPDGVGVQYAAAAFGTPIQHRHTGVDTLKELAGLCAIRGQSLLLLGGKRASAEAARAYLQALYPTLDVSAYDPGPLGWDGETWQQIPEAVHQVLEERQPAVVAVALGQDKQEAFAEDVLTKHASVRVAIGVGGAFEMLGGLLPRAPESWRDAGMEWLWRLGLEPRRAVRIARAVLVFPITVALATLKQRTFFTACWSVARLLLLKARS